MGRCLGMCPTVDTGRDAGADVAKRCHLCRSTLPTHLRDGDAVRQVKRRSRKDASVISPSAPHVDMGQTQYLTVKQFIKLIETLKREEGLSDNSLIMFDFLTILNTGIGVNTYYDISANETVKSEVVVKEDFTYDSAVLSKYRWDGEKWTRVK